uniref:Uncharacterized protein n=1 Tax=uncultured marine virus TaxID=186617 RepID=A0A0F7L296_9VIRU|nr:hypothetical protein [uncultured marine virus]
MDQFRALPDIRLDIADFIADILRILRSLYVGVFVKVLRLVVFRGQLSPLLFRND